MKPWNNVENQAPSGTYWRVQLLCEKVQAMWDADDLTLLRALLAICQKSRKPSFWEVVNSFVLLAYASLAASRTRLQRLLAFPNFTLC